MSVGVSSADKMRPKGEVGKTVPAATPARETPIHRFAYANLTDRPCNFDGILGNLDATIAEAEAFLAKDPTEHDFLWNGKNPVGTLVSLPRAGKSRLLVEVFARRAGKTHAYPHLDMLLVIRITFNEYSCLTRCPENADPVAWAAKEYWMRVGHAVHATTVKRDTFEMYREANPATTWEDVRRLLSRHHVITAKTRVAILADEFTELLDKAAKHLPTGRSKTEVLQSIGTEVSPPAAYHRVLFSGFSNATVETMIAKSSRAVHRIVIETGWASGVVQDFALKLFEALRARNLPLPPECTSVLPSSFLVGAGHSVGIWGSALTVVTNRPNFFNNNAEQWFEMGNFIPALVQTYNVSTGHADLIDRYFEAVFADGTPRLRRNQAHYALIDALQEASLAYPATDGFVLSPLALQMLCSREGWTSSDPARRDRVEALGKVLKQIIGVAERWPPVLFVHGQVKLGGAESNAHGERFEVIVALVLELRRLYDRDFDGVPVNTSRSAKTWCASFDDHWPIVATSGDQVFAPLEARDIAKTLNEFVFVKPTDPGHVATDLMPTHGFIPVKWKDVQFEDSGIRRDVERLVDAMNLIKAMGINMPKQTYCLIARSVKPPQTDSDSSLEAAELLEKDLNKHCADRIAKLSSRMAFEVKVVAGAEMERFLTTSIRDLIREHRQ